MLAQSFDATIRYRFYKFGSLYPKIIVPTSRSSWHNPLGEARGHKEKLLCFFVPAMLGYFGPLGSLVQNDQVNPKKEALLKGL